MFRFWAVVAGISGAVGIGFAAWAAHGLPSFVPPEQIIAALDSARTAGRQQMIHTLALLGVALWSRQGGNRWLLAAGVLFLVGILGFPGGIYARLLTGSDALPLVYVVPVGGTSFVLGWLALAVAAWRTPPAQ